MMCMPRPSDGIWCWFKSCCAELVKDLSPYMMGSFGKLRMTAERLRMTLV